MGIVSSIFIFILLILSYGLNRKYKIGTGITLSTEFIAFWFIIVFGGCFHFYGLYDVSETVYFLVIIGVLAFFIGYRFLRMPKSKQYNSSTLIKKTEYLKLSTLFYVVLGLSLVIIIKQILLILPIIIAQGMSEARGEIQLDDTLLLSGSMQVILCYFAKPFAKAALIVIIVNAVRTKFTLKSSLIIILVSGIYFFSEGGRAVIMDIFFVLCYVIYANRSIIAKKSKKKIKLLVVIIALLPIAATIERGSDIIESIYSYYCGSLVFISQALSVKQDFFNDHMWGLASFQGFIKPVTGILQVIGIDKPEAVEEASEFILNAQHAVYNIAPDRQMNYFYTTYGYTYKDGGFIGVFIIQFIFGMICRFVDYKEKTRRESVRWLAIKATFFYCILYTMSYFPFAMYLHAMTLIYIYFITSKVFSRKRTIIIKSNTK